MTNPGAMLFGENAPVWSAYLLIFIAAVLPTEIWRWLGVALAGRISAESEILVWVRSVATALIAAVIAKLIFVPVGALADVPLWLRIVAAAAGFAAFLGLRRQVLVAVIAAEIVLFGGQAFIPG